MPTENADPLARLLRWSRQRHGISQLEMSLRLGVSQRHVSFVESARAQPSRVLLVAWMREVRAEDSLRNAALLHAGYATHRAGAVPQRPAAGQTIEALRRVLVLHEPNPGLVFDADWIAVAMNDGAHRLCELLTPARGTVSFLLVQTVFGLPQDVTVEALRAELWFPADEATTSLLRELASADVYPAGS